MNFNFFDEMVKMRDFFKTKMILYIVSFVVGLLAVIIGIAGIVSSAKVSSNGSYTTTLATAGTFSTILILGIVAASILGIVNLVMSIIAYVRLGSFDPFVTTQQEHSMITGFKTKILIGVILSFFGLGIVLLILEVIIYSTLKKFVKYNQNNEVEAEVVGVN